MYVSKYPELGKRLHCRSFNPGSKLLAKAPATRKHCLSYNVECTIPHRAAQANVYRTRAQSHTIPPKYWTCTVTFTAHGGYPNFSEHQGRVCAVSIQPYEPKHPNQRSLPCADLGLGCGVNYSGARAHNKDCLPWRRLRCRSASVMARPANPSRGRPAPAARAGCSVSGAGPTWQKCCCIVL